MFKICGGVINFYQMNEFVEVKYINMLENYQVMIAYITIFVILAIQVKKWK